MAELDRRLRLAMQAGLPGRPEPAADGEGRGATTDAEEPQALPEAESGGIGAPADTSGMGEPAPEDLGSIEPSGEPPGAEELPGLETLVGKLRPEVVTALDELFRAKWTTVKRLRPEDLKRGG